MVNFQEMMRTSIETSIVICPSIQRRQSGLKSGWSWIRVKKFRFCRKISEKFGFFQAISQTKISIFQGKLLKNFNFVRWF